MDKSDWSVFKNNTHALISPLHQDSLHWVNTVFTQKEDDPEWKTSAFLKKVYAHHVLNHLTNL